MAGGAAGAISAGFFDEAAHGPAGVRSAQRSAQRQGQTCEGVLPALRSRQPRRFPAARPCEPVVQLCWDDAPPTDAVFSALQRLARDTAYVGHSASLTRCHFRRIDGAPVHEPGEPVAPVRQIYPGRLAELRRTFAAGRRPAPGAPLRPPPPVEPMRTNVFGERWLLLEHLGGDMPDIRACALVGKAIRDAILSGYRQIGCGDDIPEVISGHSADGTPTRAPHLAIVPLPFAGFPYADGHVMGFAIVPPSGHALRENKVLLSALRALSRLDGTLGRRQLTINSRQGTPTDRGFAFDLSLSFEAPEGKRSLDPALYTGSDRTFATVTPIVLDRHLKESGPAREDEIRALIEAACRNVGLPQPEAIATDKHSVFEGAPSAYPSGSSPAWMRWRLPGSLASRQLSHAVVRFAEPVAGPVILGAGRFVGLGLCRPLDGESR